MNSSFDALETEIVTILNSIAGQGNGLNTTHAWTQTIKQELGKIGLEKQYGVCAGGLSSIEGIEPEWLFDMVWYEPRAVYKGNKFYTHLERLSLIMECEWKCERWETQYDFEKLLVGRADHKVMICQAWNVTIDEYWNYFEEAVSTFSGGDIRDRYLLAIYNNDKMIFDYRLAKFDIKLYE